MEYLYEYIILMVSAIIGFFIKRLFNKVDRMEVEFNEHKEKDLESYATKDDLANSVDGFKEFLKEVIAPLNRKTESIEEHLRMKSGRRKSTV